MPLETALRAEPELRGRSVAIADGDTLVAGSLRGLRVAQARAVDPGISVRRLALEGIHSTQEALLDVALSVSPRVESAALGEIFIDLAGTQALFPSDRGLLTALRARLDRVGLRGAQLGIGPSRTVASLAARHRGGDRSVLRHEQRSFLAPLPIDLLEPDDELASLLTRWGVRTLGELAALPRSALGARLGKSGVRLARRAQGEDEGPFRPAPARVRFAEHAESEFAIESLDALSFALRALLHRLVERLGVRGLSVKELAVELGLAGGELAVRRIAAAAPTADVPTLLSLVRLALERDPPRDAVERLRVVATPGKVEPAQLDLFLPPLPAPAELAVAMAQLETLCGPGRVGAPALQDTHRPDAPRIQSFRATESRRSAPASTAPAIHLALRAVRPARRISVDVRGGVPHRVELPDPRGSSRVTRCAGPWRLFGEWWGESCFARDYFDVELGDGGLYRVYQNLREGDWFLDGIYD